MTDNSGSPDAVVIERTFDAPVDLIWQMWTDPEHFKAWYGPEGATIPVAKMDVRVGGSRLVCMEVQSPATTEVRVELEDVDGRTRMVMTHAGIPAGSPGAAGWAMALDKLATHVGAHGDREY